MITSTPLTVAPGKTRLFWFIFIYKEEFFFFFYNYVSLTRGLYYLAHLEDILIKITQCMFAEVRSKCGEVFNKIWSIFRWCSFSHLVYVHVTQILQGMKVMWQIQFSHLTLFIKSFRGWQRGRHFLWTGWCECTMCKVLCYGCIAKINSFSFRLIYGAIRYA